MRTTGGFCPLGQQLISSVSIAKALSSATNSKELHKIHSLLITLGLAKSVFFSGKLITKYAKFKDPLASLSVFQRVSPTSSVYQWNTIIRAMTHNGLFSQALGFYSQMKILMVKPDAYTFPTVINACAGLLNFEMGKLVHDDVIEMGFASDLYISNALIDMYSRFNDLVCARKVFDEMPDKDVVSWNSLISGYSSNWYCEEALEFFHKLRMASIVPDCFTVSSVLPACGSLVAIGEGQVVHGLVEKFGFKGDTIVSNGLLSMYFKFDRLTDCDKVFDEMLARDTITWNTLICGYSQSGLYEESIKLFMEMLPEFKPDLLTITSVLCACGHVEDLKYGRYVHEYMMRNGYECDTTASNILINMYAKCGNLLVARETFDQMKCRDLVSWNSLINGYIRNGSCEEAMKIFNMMKMDLKPDFVTYLTLLSMCAQLIKVDHAKELHCDIMKLGIDSSLVVCNALVDMYAKCGKIADSLKQFEEMKSRDIITWNTIIAACVHSEECDLGFKMICRMRMEGQMPDGATILGTLPICSQLSAKRQGKEIHGYIFKMGFESDVPIGNALIELYSKCGSLKHSLLVFDHMKSKDVVTWTALISAYGLHGEGKKALRAFEEMKRIGIFPDHIAFVAIIYSCSHSGLVEEGRACFDQMKKDYNIEPKIEHYACVVDLLSRSGLLAEAEEFIHSMPMKPDTSIWGALLSVCRASGDIKLAERVSKHIIELNSNDTGYYVLVSNVYATLGKWDQVRTIRKSLKTRGLVKDQGFSWLEIQNRVYVFGSGNRFFEQYEEVHKLLKKLSSLMAKEGYVANLEFALHDVEEDEKRDMLCGHSERLAIAFGLLNTKPGTSLQVMKNLRVCGDCHTFTKYVSKIVQRELLVRDANRFHLFKDGICSCGDYW
ncbi:hypothetical protein LguiA_019391 [Lonicera macranthoides]